MQEVKKGKKGRKQSSKNPLRLLPVIAIFGFLIYSAVTIISQSILVSQKRAELEELNRRIQIQEIKNEDIKSILNYTGAQDREYMEQIARQELDYIAQGERVFINIAGD